MKTLRFSKAESSLIKKRQQFLLDWVSDNIEDFMGSKRKPPGPADCRVLAAAMVRRLIVATDDESMLRLAAEMEIPAIRCCDVLHKLWSAGRVQDGEVVTIYQALHRNGDMPAHWLVARGTLFKRIKHRLTDDLLQAWG